MAAYAGEEWKGMLALYPDVLSCLCNNRYFVDLAPRHQADILASIILPKTHTWADWVQPAPHAAGLRQTAARAMRQRVLAYREKVGR